MDIALEFKNQYQKDFFNLTDRNQAFSGGFGNGKTYIACAKAFILLSTFPKYKFIITRRVLKDLRETTMRTFFKICPEQFVAAHSDLLGYTKLKNGSEVLWKQASDISEESLRGQEPNSILIDQAEEVEESTYLILDSRVGRWDQAEVPEYLVKQYPNWPKSANGKYRPPNYHMVLCNPDSLFHWIYRYYHQDSVEKRLRHSLISAPSDPSLMDPATYEQMRSRDPEWVARFVDGEWGISDAQLHTIHRDSILEYNPEFLETILAQGALYRSFDHGESAPSCCTWWSAWKGFFICYREYYVPNRTISYHRKAISELSEKEQYQGSYADPSIFKRTTQKDGGFWSVADEYITSDIDGPTINWTKADNNEFATRNRINELLAVDPSLVHPITGTIGSPRILFIKRGIDNQNGAFHTINETQSQRRKLLGSFNGRSIYSDDREDSITDHAYDTLRYFVAMHGSAKRPPRRAIPIRSFAFFENLRNRKSAPVSMSN